MAGKDLRSLRTEDGHMNESGDRLIAEALAEGLGRLGQLH
jgi:lysophospholipase L1-like esterase